MFFCVILVYDSLLYLSVDSLFMRYLSAYCFVKCAPNNNIRLEYDTHNMIKIIEPAAPYVDPGSIVLKYNANRYLPIINISVVNAAPTRTDFHGILADGKYLNIVANNI